MVEKRLRAAVLGATGSVGQKLVTLLDRHPFFEVTVLAASPRSAGKPYRQAVHWLDGAPIPEAVAELEVVEVAPDLDCDVAFSALGSGVARQVEPALAAAGVAVVSNASAFRMAADVPLLVPEVNPDHAELVRGQRYDPRGRGFIVTNPNCSTTGLVCALKPLDDAFGVEAVHVTTLQAVSGAGYPGVSSLDVLGNVVPFIPGEEEKLEAEPRKILGRLGSDRILPAGLTVSAQATRVPVVDGHLLAVSVKLRRPPPSPDAAAEALRRYRSPLAGLALPSAPQRLLEVLDGDGGPQPRLHAGAGAGMTVTAGRLRPCPLLDLRLMVLVHNTLRGAAGGAVLNAELLAAKGLLGSGARVRAQNA
ncbi:MAG: aspartate-semialdehyde dehydrogenase [Acidobacteria bacterium]|nr:MAG: aspartate-semialdehyde dehydrogenase [Acidobacteriota bacterium]